MTIQDEILAVLKDASIRAYPHRAPQGAAAPFTAFRQLDQNQEQTLSEGVAIRQTIFVFFSVGKTAASAAAQRDLVVATIAASAELKTRYAFQVSSGEAEYDAPTDEEIEPCAFSFWHD